MPPAHVVALVAATLTFALLLLGGVVHGTGSSLACPDWPTCYGDWMPEMKGGILYEHSHRMLGAAVGVVTIVLAVVLSRNTVRRLRLAGYAALAIVVFQGVLGGVTVLLRLPTAVSTAHLATAMLFFSLLLWISWRTRPGAAVETGPPLRGFTGAALVALFLQIVLGALVRHTGAGMACPDLPLCHGRFWPTAGVLEGGAALAGAAKLHAVHRMVGVAVALILVGVAVAALRDRSHGAHRRIATALLVLVPLQVTLGVLSVTSVLGLCEVTAHLGVGALLLGTTFLFHWSLPPAKAAPVLTPGRGP